MLVTCAGDTDLGRRVTGRQGAAAMVIARAPYTAMLSHVTSSPRAIPVFDTLDAAALMTPWVRIVDTTENRGTLCAQWIFGDASELTKRAQALKARKAALCSSQSRPAAAVVSIGL